VVIPPRLAHSLFGTRVFCSRSLRGLRPGAWRAEGAPLKL
jgi:hypothetical protein